MAQLTTLTPTLTHNVINYTCWFTNCNRLLRCSRNNSTWPPIANILDLDQGALFDSEGVELLSLDDEPTADTLALTPKKRESGDTRRGLRVNKDLPVERIDIELPQAEQVCGDCGGDLHRIGTEMSTRLEYVPAQLIQKELHRHQYACRGCEGGITRADLPHTPRVVKIKS